MRVVVVGASVAGVAACDALRRAGYTDEIVLVGAETAAPYDRPPLSKQFLAGSMSEPDILLRQPADLGVTSRLGTVATRLDVASRRLEVEPGGTLEFDGLIVATGSQARRLPGVPDARGIEVLRTLDDALAIRDGLAKAESAVVVGAGFIGLEVASVAASLGRRVTVLETAEQPMTRVLPAAVGNLFLALHRAHGVDVRCGTTLREVVAARGRVTGVRLDDGSTLPADLVVLGLGAAPNDHWLHDSGLRVDDGVCCDHTLKAADGVYACGDVARWPHPMFGSIRVEHWTTASQNARTAARNLLADLVSDSGEREAADAVPYFWSDQCAYKIQLAGWTIGADRLHAVADGHRFAVLFGRDERLVAVMTGGWPKVLALLRRGIAERVDLADAVAMVPAPESPADPVLAGALERLDTFTCL